MTTYIILSRFSPEAFEDPKYFKDLAATVSAKIKKQCPDKRPILFSLYQGTFLLRKRRMTYRQPRVRHSFRKSAGVFKRR